MREGYFADVLTSVVVQEITKIDGKVIEIHEGFVYFENLKYLLLKKYLVNYLNYDRNVKLKIMMLCNC